MNTSLVSNRRVIRPALGALAVLMLSACAALGGGSDGAAAIYAPDPRVSADPAWPAVAWQLSVTSPMAARMLDSTRITVRPSPNEMQVYKNASWAKRPSDMLEDALLRALEDSGRIPAVARQGSGVSADYKLVLDLRRFESAYPQTGGMPSATIEFNAKLLYARDQQVVATRTFLHAQPAASTAVPDVVVAFEQALGAVSHELAGWILNSGAAHDRGAKR